MLAFLRPPHFACAVNFGAEPVELPGRTLLRSDGFRGDGEAESAVLPGDTAVWQQH